MGFGGDAARDGPLPLARRRLADAVHALADPAPQWIGGVCRWSDALYVSLRVELSGGRWSAVGGRFGAVPCRGDVLALLVEIDAAVGSWQPDGKGTVDRLHQLAGRAFRPQDCDLIGDYCSTMERWTLAGTELLTETPRVFLRQPCPRCGARFTYRRDDGCWAASRCRRDCLPGRLSQRQLSIKDHRTDHLRTMPTWSYEASEC